MTEHQVLRFLRPRIYKHAGLWWCGLSRWNVGGCCRTGDTPQQAYERYMRAVTEATDRILSRPTTHTSNDA